MNELRLVIAHRLLVVLGGSVSLHETEPRGLAVRLDLSRHVRPKDEAIAERGFRLEDYRSDALISHPRFPKRHSAIFIPLTRL